MKKRWLVASAGAALLGGASALFACGAVQRPDGGSGLLPEGAMAPAVSGVDQNGATRSLAAERGHPVVVYFYPKDGTPGCTTEACAFRDAWATYREAGVQVFGVSSDDRESHAEFAKEHGLPFPLVADDSGAWATAFGVPSMLGLTKRVTFLVDARGRVAKVYPDVDPGVHAARVLEDAKKLR